MLCRLFIMLLRICELLPCQPLCMQLRKQGIAGRQLCCMLHDGLPCCFISSSCCRLSFRVFSLLWRAGRCQWIASRLDALSTVRGCCMCHDLLPLFLCRFKAILGVSGSAVQFQRVVWPADCSPVDVSTKLLKCRTRLTHTTYLMEVASLQRGRSPLVRIGHKLVLPQLQ